MSSSLPPPPMAFRFGIHQSTTPFAFSREIDDFTTIFRKRPLSNPSPSGPSRKKRRLRLSLTTSPLSLPFSTPRTSSQPDRTAHRNGSNSIIVLRPLQKQQQYSPRPVPSAFPPASSCSLLRKAAVLNRVQQRLDAACQRNPNLRWEKEQRQEREMLLREGIEMQRMAALKDGLLSPVSSTRPVASQPPASDGVVRYLDPRHRSLAAGLAFIDCRGRRSNGTGCIENGYSTRTMPSLPSSAVGLSNYDALDSEEADEKHESTAAIVGGGEPQQQQQQQQQQKRQSCTNATMPEAIGAVVDADDEQEEDEGMRDIFDFLTPPARHQSFLSAFEGDGDDGSSSSSSSQKREPDKAPPLAHHDEVTQRGKAGFTVGQCERRPLLVDARAATPPPPPTTTTPAAAAANKTYPSYCIFPRCLAPQSPYLCLSHSPRPPHHNHSHHHQRHQHHHHRRNGPHHHQQHCARAAAAAAAAAACVAVPRAH